jgi:tripartite-type tricarboxylate transporter receptor subunit TctC
MKRYLALVLALVMACGILAGCGGSKSSSTPAPAASTEAAPASSAPAAEPAKTVDWPGKSTIAVTLPYGAGGDTDTYCRALFQKVQEKTGGTFVITNLTGGSGIVAAQDVRNKPADGKTLLFTHTGSSLVQMATDTVDFSFIDDFEQCCTVALDQTYTLVCIAPEGEYKQYSHGWTNLEDMLAEAKANPGTVRYSAVFGSTTEYVGNRLATLAGVEFDNIDVGTSSGDRLAALLGGQVDLLAVNFMNVADYVEKGDVLVLGVMAPERVKGMDFPTLKEQGYDVVNAKKYEIKFPKGTDQAIVDTLAEICKDIVENDAEFAETLAKYYAEPFYRDGATMAAEDAAEVEDLRANLG